MKVSRFEDLDCWKEARQLTRQVYEAIGRNPLLAEGYSAMRADSSSICIGVVERS
jgi:hypothetical protein